MREIKFRFTLKDGNFIAKRYMSLDELLDSNFALEQMEESINYESIRRLDKRSVSGICLCCGGTSTAASSVNRQKSATSNTT